MKKLQIFTNFAHFLSLSTNQIRTRNSVITDPDPYPDPDPLFITGLKDFQKKVQYFIIFNGLISALI
jgi:hypothetical protein